MMSFNAERVSPRARRFHVFPTGPMCSLRRALLLWLVPLFVVVGAATAAYSYWSYGRMVSEFMDEQMHQLAQSIAASEQPMPPIAPSGQRIRQMGTFVIQVWGADGKLQATSWPQLAAARQPDPGFHDLSLDGARWRVYTTPMQGGSGHSVQVFQSGDFRSELAAERAGAAILPLLILLPLAILVLWGVAGAMSRAIADIGRTAASQDAHRVADLPLERVPQELKPLVQSFNNLLGRVRDAFAAQGRFVQDAAHELRTPITAVALQLENVRRELPDGACKQTFSQLEAGVTRAQRLVEQLLKLSRQQAPVAEASREVNLHTQLHESMNALIGLADQRNIDLGIVGEIEGRPPTLRCAPGDLRSVLDNLIENALRYTPEGGVVDVHVISDGARPAIEVIDSGPGIPPHLLPRVFDRFFRVPGSAAGGSGLGLAIAQAAAQRCGLRVRLRNRDDRSGLVARIELA